jgi:hypothetical protein
MFICVYTQLFNIDSFTVQDPFGSYIVADVCLDNPENNISNCELYQKKADSWMVLLQQY